MARPDPHHLRAKDSKRCLPSGVFPGSRPQTGFLEASESSLSIQRSRLLSWRHQARRDLLFEIEGQILLGEPCLDVDCESSSPVLGPDPERRPSALGFV